jgi:TonB family protein
MESIASPPPDTELNLLTDWNVYADRSRRRNAAVYSVVAHVVLIFFLGVMPPGVMEPRPAREAPRVTPLVAPPPELTQRAPNKQKISKEFDVVDALERPKVQIPNGAPSTTRPRAFRPLETPRAAPVRPTAPLPEPPKMENAPPKVELPQIAQATPQIEAVERPKLALENPAAPPPVPAPGQSKIAIPNASVSEAVRQAVRGGASGGLTIGDLDLSGPGGVGPGLNLPPAPGSQGSNLELLSDPQGVDFRPYLMQVLAAVRRNWLAVIPESVKLGRRGRVGIQFSIARAGAVPKLVIVSNSGTEALDRAAVAGISASNPFPPLPSEYKGDRIVLQFNFAYNVPRR